FAFDADDFRRCVSPRTKVVVCISPSNPTGRVLTNDDMATMARALADTNAYVVSDEIYRELYYTPARPASVSDHYARTVVIGGLSKSMSMTGWRLGWLCGDAAVVRSALVLHGYTTTCAATIVQKTALAAWTDEAAQARAAARRTFQARRDHLLDLIERELHLRAVAPEGAFYAMVDVSAYGASMQVTEAMLAQGVITVPGAAFGREGEGFLRVSFCAEPATLTEGVCRMKKAIKQ
ncbi:MAG TPA: pyridoxal phosphate-dependent aminotransferase, partial [Pyrinomonadaceae bacterium]|nr:pyridoxal phosphate-dependent aminotransferase [Pyrinomonadaceae bacterium]